MFLVIPERGQGPFKIDILLANLNAWQNPMHVIEPKATFRSESRDIPRTGRTPALDTQPPVLPKTAGRAAITRRQRSGPKAMALKAATVPALDIANYKKLGPRSLFGKLGWAPPSAV